MKRTYPFPRVKLIEPSVDEIMEDSVFLALLESDGLVAADVRRLIEDLRQKRMPRLPEASAA